LSHERLLNFCFALLFLYLLQSEHVQRGSGSAANYAKLAPAVRLEDLLCTQRDKSRRHGLQPTMLTEEWITDALWREPSLERTRELLMNHNLVRFAEADGVVLCVAVVFFSSLLF
jgi:hypothetical protein